MTGEIARLMILILLLVSSNALAKDFGQHGAIFEIKEEGFLTMIYRKLNSLDMKKEKKRMLQVARRSVEKPAPVMGIKRTEEGRVFTYDPSYVLAGDVHLPGGELLMVAGTKVNPLDHVPMQRKLVFIDGIDEEQIRWVEGQRSAGGITEEDKLVLIAGSPFSVESQLGRNVYFDQRGMLTKRFGIKQVPAVVEQASKEDRFLTISEIYIEAKEKELQGNE